MRMRSRYGRAAGCSRRKGAPGARVGGLPYAAVQSRTRYGATDMHVAMLVESASPARPSGVERSAAAVIDGLRARGVRETVLTATLGPTGGHGDALAVDMRARFQILRGYRPWVRSVHEVLRQVAPDVVHGQGLLHNGVAAARWSGCPSVVTAHGDPVQDARWHYPRLALPLLVPLVRAAAAEAVADASALVDVSPDWAVNCPREPRNWVYVPNPVGDAFYGAPPPTPSERVLYFGGGRHIKGLDILLDAWPLVMRTHPRATLHVWGMPADGGSALASRCRATPAPGTAEVLPRRRRSPGPLAGLLGPAAEAPRERRRLLGVAQADVPAARREERAQGGRGIERRGRAVGLDGEHEPADPQAERPAGQRLSSAGAGARGGRAARPARRRRCRRSRTRRRGRLGLRRPAARRAGLTSPRCPAARAPSGGAAADAGAASRRLGIDPNSPANPRPAGLETDLARCLAPCGRKWECRWVTVNRTPPCTPAATIPNPNRGY